MSHATMIFRLYLFLCCFIAEPIFAQVISSGSTWKYLDNGTDQGTAWKNAAFNDINWASGASPLGYGDGDEATVVNFGGNTSNKYVTTYFRKSFSITTLFSNYKLRVKRDDGVVVYINGNEVFRDNIATNQTYQTLASSASDDGNTWLETTIAGTNLQVGTNIIAVEIHQTSVTSSDISFDFELLHPNYTVSRGPYLQMGTSNSMQIRWRTNIASTTKVNYGANPTNLNSNVVDATLTTEHIVNLPNISPNTQYYYSIGTATEVLQGNELNYFITAPTIGTEKKTRVWVTGDCGTGVPTQIAVKNKFLNYVGSQYIDLWLLLGDNAYNYGYDSEYQTRFFEPYQNDRIMKQTVLFPTPGNHDYGATGTAQSDHIMPYYSNFSLPSNGEVGGVPSGHKEYYSYNYANIHFVSLDSYGTETGNNFRLYDATSPQITWLKADLTANTQKWTVLYWHHPPYTMGSHNSDNENELRFIRENVVPILEQYKVDLVLCGHSHNYERSRLMKGHTGLEPTFNATLHNPTTSSGKYDGSTDSCPYIKTSSLPNTGIIYVVAGSAGWATGTQTSYPHDAMYFSHTANAGSLYLEIEANRLDAKWIADDGEVKDKFTMMKDVNIKQTITQANNLTNITLNSSWIGNYAWQNSSFSSRSLIVSPINNTQYIVKDGSQCLADTFLIQISNPNCQPVWNLTGEIASNSLLKYEAGQSITANNLLNNGANVKYNAAKAVILLPGFQVQNGVIFNASIGGCTNTNVRRKSDGKSP